MAVGSGLLWAEAQAASPGVVTSTVGAGVKIGATAGMKITPFVVEYIAGVLPFRWVVFGWVLFWCGKLC